jgi:nucleoside-diphosphate-sugar epimerase
MRALIFGANGQDGYYLNELCKQKGFEAIGVSRSGSWIRGDVSSYEQVEKLIEKYVPTYVFHLAAISTTRHEALFENRATISTGTLNILEAAKRICPASRVFITGSGLQFKIPASRSLRMTNSMQTVHTLWRAFILCMQLTITGRWDFAPMSEICSTMRVRCGWSIMSAR